MIDCADGSTGKDCGSMIYISTKSGNDKIVLYGFIRMILVCIIYLISYFIFKMDAKVNWDIKPENSFTAHQQDG